MTGLSPRFLTIIRGQVLCWGLGAAIVPWKFLTDAAKFITFLGSYTVLMAAILGPLLADYYVVRRGNIHMYAWIRLFRFSMPVLMVLVSPSLFVYSKDSIYWFTRGFNWRGCLVRRFLLLYSSSFICCNLVGMVCWNRTHDLWNSPAVQSRFNRDRRRSTVYVSCVAVFESHFQLKCVNAGWVGCSQ